MIPLLLVGAAGGVTCGLARLKVWSLVPAIVLFLIITVIDSRLTGLGVGATALAFFIGSTFLQLLYFVGSLLLQERTRPASAPMPSRPELVRLVQLAIGQEMRMSWALPVDLPPQLGVRVAQLQAKYG
jgi:hypothetical protein